MTGRIWAAVLGLALLGGCAAHSGETAKSHTANGPQQSDAPANVAYSLELLPGPGAAVRVTMRVTGEADGSSRLAVAPSWGGVENCERFVHGLAVRDAAGHECRVTTDPASPHGWDVVHEPGAAIIATYELRPRTPDPLGSFGTHYEPVVRDDLLHLIGETGFIYPEWLENAGPIDIAWEWVGFKERGWTVVSSFDDSGGRVRRPMQEFRHAMFLAGRDVRVHDRQVRGGTVRVAVYGDDWAFRDAELVDLVERIVSAERQFTGDFGDPYFLVTVAPTGPRATAQSLSMGGTGLTNCFALFLSPGVTVDGDRRNRVLRLLAHEYFHTWNGGKVQPEEPEELVYWFSEGFTDFYASRILRRAGLIDDAEWAARLNETLRNLWLSPVATAPAERIRRDFWSDQAVQQLPYQRGEIVALMIDEEIRRVSGGSTSLDDLFLELLADARRGERVQTERLLGRLARWTSDEFAQRVRRVVVDGAMPEPPARLSEPPGARQDVQSYQWEPGFDVDATVKDRVVAGVREGSAAYAAGLRDGQAVAGMSIHHGDPDHQIMLKVKDGDAVREVLFWPRGQGVTVPRYLLQAGVGGTSPAQ